MKMYSIRIVDGNSPHSEHGFTLFANSPEEVYLHVRGKEAPENMEHNGIHIFYDGDVVEIRENTNFDHV